MTDNQFFLKMHQLKAAILLYQSSLERKNFVSLKETQRLVQYGKLREVSVSSFFRADNYAVAKGKLVNKYCTKVKLRAAIVRETRHFPDE